MGCECVGDSEVAEKCRESRSSFLAGRCPISSLGRNLESFFHLPLVDRFHEEGRS